jgi:hypothetical protein
MLIAVYTIKDILWLDLSQRPGQVNVKQVGRKSA